MLIVNRFVTSKRIIKLEWQILEQKYDLYEKKIETE